MSKGGVTFRKVDVVILVAITLEYQAALEVEEGALQGSRWEPEKGPNGLPVAFRSFQGARGRPLRVALAQAGDMGAVAAMNALLPLVHAYAPKCIAMCGVCAGRPRKTRLGDVVAAERLFFHDAGKQLPNDVQQDLKSYNLREDWKLALEHMDFAGRFRDRAWWKKRPIPYEWQENWLLAKLHEGVAQPDQLPECEELCPQWEKVVSSLWESGHLKDSTLEVTDEGRKRIGRILILHHRQFPDLSPAGAVLPFKVHVAPMGSGNKVVEDEKCWGFISEYMRKTLGLEMEAAALGALAHAQRDSRLDALVMKGVMDFANHGRDDHFKEFAARVSAECVLAFLRKHVEPEVAPGIDDLLTDGHVDLEPDAPPSALLSARHEVVPWHEPGREEVLVELDRWCDDASPVAVRLLHAEGGVGKTRLAIEWSRRRRAEGWAAGFLAKGEPEDWFERLCALGRPLVAVLDYAEVRADLREVLLRVLRYGQQQGTGSLQRVRLLLLARSDGDWWQSLKQYDTALGAWLDASQSLELQPLATRISEREAVFLEAARRFAERGQNTPVERSPIELSDARFDHVLYLHMAALATVAHLSFEANTLMDTILDHEERFWEERARQAGVALASQRSLARQIMAASTLRGGLADPAEASAVVGRLLRRALTQGDEDLLRLLHRVYQGVSGGVAAYIPALEPDLLGEGIVLRVSAPKLTEDRPPLDWIERVFPPYEAGEAVLTGFSVLGRASATGPGPAVIRPWMEWMLNGPQHERAALALEAAKQVGHRTPFSLLGEVLADWLVAGAGREVARVLERVGLPYPTVSLRRVAEWVSRALLRDSGDGADEPSLAEHARLLNNHSIDLASLGQREEALAAAKQAVAVYRRLAERNADAFQPDLAMSLNNLGARWSALGRREEALEALKEAVAIYRKLTECNADAFQPDLAGCLNNLGAGLSDLGRREEALEALKEAVAIHRKPAERNADAFQPDLAMSLNNLGTRLSDLGRREEALEALKEAVTIYRKLVERNADAFQVDLAGSLNNLGAGLNDLGRQEEALEALKEAVTIYRKLAARNADAFQPDLAGSLSNLGNRLSDVGRREEALEAFKESVAIRRKLAKRNADAFQADLAGSLSNLGNGLSDVGRREEALEAFKESVAIRRKLAERNADAFQADLAGSLNNLGNGLSDVGRREEALEALKESVAIRRKLAERNADAFQPRLAGSLNNLGNRLSDLGRREEALEALKESVAIYRKLAERSADAFQPHLAMSLNNLGSRLSDVGRREEALEALKESVAIRRKLAGRNADAFQADLAGSLNNLGNGLSDVGRREEALDAAKEAVAIYRKLAERNAPAFQAALAGSLNNLGAGLSDLGRREEALDSAKEAVAIYRKLAEHSADAFQPALAASLNNLGNRLSDLGQREEALEIWKEAVAIRRELAERSADAFQPDLAASLNNLGNGLSALGRRAEALEILKEAVAIRRKLAERNADAFQPHLATSLNNLGAELDDLGRREEALEILEEAVAIYRKLAERNADAFQPDLAASLNNLGNGSSALGRQEEALGILKEAVAIYRKLAERNADAFQPHLATSLNNLGAGLSALGQREEALEILKESVAICRKLAERNADAFQPLLAASLSNLEAGLSALGWREEALVHRR
ncbi:tetratricopeptide repeat protein [Sorangium sp. So ce119]|uniref:tetratricopeptide repeat protein n=1 Tax=Sorangium sp. So ce119 TaxID=3133279 RepID=UPI003F5ED679